MARVLLACPPRMVKKWTEAEVDPDLEKRIGVVFDALFALSHEVDGDGELSPRVLPLNPEAKVIWTTFYDAHAAEQVVLSGDLAAAWSKLEAYAARLALVIHIVRWAAGDRTLQAFGTIDAASMAAGVELVRWFGHEARRVYGMLSEDEGDTDRRRLVEWIRRTGGVVTIRDAMRSGHCFKTSDAAERALKELVSAGVGEWEDGPTGITGRPLGPRFRLTDSTDTDISQETQADSDGSVSVSCVSASGIDGASDRPPDPDDPEAVYVYHERAGIAAELELGTRGGGADSTNTTEISR